MWISFLIVVTFSTRFANPHNMKGGEREGRGGGQGNKGKELRNLFS